MTATIGVVALGRNTFDVPFAEEITKAAFARLDDLDVKIVGPRELLFDADAVLAALPALKAQPLDLLLLLQVTFTDATMTVALADEIDAPVALWGFPEPRTGERLRLNSLCGINLAAHALRRGGTDIKYLFGAPDTTDLTALTSGVSASEFVPASGTREMDETGGAKVVEALKKVRIGVFGQHPDGFHTCEYDPAQISAMTGATVEAHALPGVFDRARGIDADRVADIHAKTDKRVANLADMEPEALDKGLRVYAALSDLAKEGAYTGLAVRCWPEFFTDYGCAACGAMAMISGDGIPCACEADVFGNLSSQILQSLTDEPVFLADLVDIDTNDDTGVFWHCGLAPDTMADPDAGVRVGIHSNRKKPLLHEFPLKPGRITVARLSQSRGEVRMILAGGEMIKRPNSFSGTSGVARFDRPASEILDGVMGEGLEHHYSFAYGEFRPALRAAARSLNIPVVELT
ncbi:MAG: fucose isomerase [Rhodospirillales bacterium]|jgi:L-fucose isomerase-like protein|nr:fucose isomerase [Rhodospirillales bacterium]